MIGRLRLARDVAADVRRWGAPRHLAIACGLHALFTGVDGEVPPYLLSRIEPLLWPRLRLLGDLLGVTPAPGESVPDFLDRLDLLLR